MKRAAIVILTLFVWTSSVLAATVRESKIISYGKDLTSEERILIFREMPLPDDVKSEDIKSIEVTNEEEWKLLKGLVPDDEIGTKAISSVYVEKLDAGEGLKVETKNLTFVTPQMMANALVTAGVRDARIYATAPQEVSGTAALTGIYKAIEALTGKALSSTAKQLAARELIQTGNLGERVGKEKAAVLVERSKERIVEAKNATTKMVEEIVTDTAKEQNITLTESEKKELIEILIQVKKSNLGINELKTQLKNFEPAEEEKKEKDEPDSWFDRVIQFISSIIDRFFSFAGRFFRFKR